MSNLLIKFSLCIIGTQMQRSQPWGEVRQSHAKHVDTKCSSEDAMILVFMSSTGNVVRMFQGSFTCIPT